jgi:hypothetical protein
MRSIGLVLLVEKPNANQKYKVISSFYETIQPRPECKPDHKCLEEFWQHHPQEWEHVNADPKPVDEVMEKLSRWLQKQSLRYNLKFVAGPCNVDWMFLKCNYEAFGPADKHDIGFFCHDLTSLKRGYMLLHCITDKHAFSARISDGLPYRHNALDDAMYQGVSYMNLRYLFSCSSLRHHRPYHAL